MDVPTSPHALLPARAGTFGGTLLSVLLQVSTGELLKTVVLAAAGAAVSFLVSHGLQRLLQRRPRKNGR